jgi:importin subunit alpha-6/7
MSSLDIAERKAGFKPTVDNEDSRRRREETTRQIRKSKREDQLRKRRMGMAQAEQAMTPADQEATTTTVFSKKASIEDLPAYKHVLESSSSTMEELVEATRGIRRLLSVDRDPPVDAVLNAGLLPYLIRNLTVNAEASTLIFESAWALTNVASTSKTSAVVEAAGIEPLVALLRHENPDVREQAAWCLGNIAGDTTEYRDLLLYHGIVEPLMLNITQPANMSLLNNVIWTVSNLCRGKPTPDMMYLAPLLAPLGEVLFRPVSMDVLVDAVWALSYLSDGPNHRIEQVMRTGITSKLIEFLSDTKSPLITPTLRCLGNFVTGSDSQTQAVLDAGIVQCLHGLLEHPKVSFACFLAVCDLNLRPYNDLKNFPDIAEKYSEGELLACLQHCCWHPDSNQYAAA